MIQADKLDNAFYALQCTITAARKMAYEKKPHKEIADILDATEYLPYLIMNDEDNTRRFREYLVAIGEKHKECICVEFFDQL
jgi:hypothetical protein